MPRIRNYRDVLIMFVAIIIINFMQYLHPLKVYVQSTAFIGGLTFLFVGRTIIFFVKSSKLIGQLINFILLGLFYFFIRKYVNTYYSMGVYGAFIIGIIYGIFDKDEKESNEQG